MLADRKTYTSFSTSPDKFAAVKDFYVTTVGLNLEFSDDYLLRFKTGGDTRFMVYTRDDHRPAEYTVLNFDVKDVEAVVKFLSERGLMMEQYPSMETNEVGISEMDGMKMAWFKDPAGNIIGLMQNLS